MDETSTWRTSSSYRCLSWPYARLYRLFGTESIDCVLFDLEFDGKHWVMWLNGKLEQHALISYNKPEESLAAYKRCRQIKTMFRVIKCAGVLLVVVGVVLSQMNFRK